ncbi:phosphate ABC transporter substrate-binding protein [Caballeronia mineralivorans PML1(12)]|uniref:Phosphate ABC transporter substrate-binding protein n=1 Tax=Caballeronia mineralivorans PML1(12) TaxID=908627 RepID=A0A0J1CWW3_9BURK|nr:substrate-binding domain-containing protein [Caballeronia mineralivorans]KLU24871.1 phosphate ABC transporter substrate-binding protein [Caballeronia mineralivorans PML1(12)]
MKSSKRKICQAVALVISALAASAAMAQTAPALLGGGSSLVAPTIGSEISVFPSTDGTARYFSVGSGKGQTAFLKNDNTQFGTGLTGAVDFANSDAPLLASQVSAYTTTGGLGVTNGPLIQIPYIVTPITIPLVNAPTGTGPAFTGSTTPTVALNDDDLCGIFSGKIANWSNVRNPDATATNGISSFYPAGAITVVYRADASGTSDLLTAHLHQVCNTTNTASTVSFTETQSFASLFPSSTPPSNFVSATGSGGVAAALVGFKTTTTAAIGYLSPDFTNTFLAPSSTPAQTNNLSVASLANSHLTGTGNANDVLPTFGNATTAVGTVAAPGTKLLAKVPTNWVPNASNPTAGYPVSGTSQIIVSQCYANAGSNSPTPALAVVDFLNLHYASHAAILHGNGFDTVPSSFVTAINNDFLSNGSAFNLDIGNTTVCSGTVTGR